MAPEASSTLCRGSLHPFEHSLERLSQHKNALADFDGGNLAALCGGVGLVAAYAQFTGSFIDGLRLRFLVRHDILLVCLPMHTPLQESRVLDKPCVYPYTQTCRNVPDAL